jgi:hypothetical protein
LNLKIKWGCQLITISVPLIFGAETVLAGILGVLVGSLLGQRLRRDYPTADPLVCGVGLLLSAPFMVSTLILASGASAITTFTLMFYGQLFLNLNWSLVADITLVKIKIVSITLRPSCRDCGLLSSYSESVSHALSVKRVVIKYCLCLIFLL